MMTLANITKGRATFHVGAGEMKQIQPFGHDAKQKMGRHEDFYRIFDAFRRNNTTPVDFDGTYTKLDQAWLGVARTTFPRSTGWAVARKSSTWPPATPTAFPRWA
jgi:phthiodiolone/phenolphthiodiolone dimycocerosates ketoreductase